MRFLLLALLAAGAMAQTPQPEPNSLPPAMRNAIRQYVQQLTDGQVTVQPEPAPPQAAAPEQPAPRPAKTIVRVPQACAIPLKNVLRSDVPSRITIVTPPSAARNSGVNPFPMKEVQTPAPSCDDMKK